jgi:hypothetical protein
MPFGWDLLGWKAFGTAGRSSSIGLDAI